MILQILGQSEMPLGVENSYHAQECMYAPVVAPKTSFTISNLLPGLGESSVTQGKKDVSFGRFWNRLTILKYVCRIHTLEVQKYATLVSTWRQVQDWDVWLLSTLKPFCHRQRPRLLLYGSCSGHKRQGWVLGGRVPGGQMSIFGVVHADLLDAKLESLCRSYCHFAPRWLDRLARRAKSPRRSSQWRQRLLLMLPHTVH